MDERERVERLTELRKAYEATLVPLKEAMVPWHEVVDRREEVDRDLGKFFDSQQGSAAEREMRERFKELSDEEKRLHQPVVRLRQAARDAGAVYVNALLADLEHRTSASAFDDAMAVIDATLWKSAEGRDAAVLALAMRLLMGRRQEIDEAANSLRMSVRVP